MKKTSVIIVILIIAVMIVGAVGIVPLAVFKSCTDFYKVSISNPNSEYMRDVKGIVNNEALSDSIKADVKQMYNTTSDVFSKIRISYFWVAAYLILAISVFLIAVGIYFIKTESCKNYVGTSFIVSAGMLLAFTVIIGFFLYK